MIEPQHEQAQAGTGDFHDVVAIEFTDPENQLFGFLRQTRAPAGQTSALTAVLFAGDELVCSVSESELAGCPDSWDAVAIGSSRSSIEAPLERWTASLEDGESGFEIELSALSEPVELAAPDTELGELAGITEYGQLCAVSGIANVSGRSQKINATGWRVHVWGAPDWDSLASRRSLYFGSADTGIAVLTARPANAAHGEELSLGTIVSPGAAPGEFDQVLLSTVYDGQRRPNRAGAELYLPDEEYGQRLSGQAICGTRLATGARRHDITFFRWSLDGKPGFGCLQSVEPL